MLNVSSHISLWIRVTSLYLEIMCVFYVKQIQQRSRPSFVHVRCITEASGSLAECPPPVGNLKLECDGLLSDCPIITIIDLMYPYENTSFARWITQIFNRYSRIFNIDFFGKIKLLSTLKLGIRDHFPFFEWQRLFPSMPLGLSLQVTLNIHNLRTASDQLYIST